MKHRKNGGGNEAYHDADILEPADLGEFLESAMEEGKGYFEAQKEHLVLRTYKQVGQAAGGIITKLMAAVAALLFLVFASVALSLWLGSLMTSTALGFLVVGGLYLLVFLIVRYWAGDAIRRAFTLDIINSFYHGKG